MRSGLLLLMWMALSAANAADALPSPLTLRDVLAGADRLPVPVMQARWRQAELTAGRLAVEQPRQLQVSLEGEAGVHELEGRGRRYHRLQLVGRKLLYDGGREAALTAALDQEHAAERLNEQWARAQYRLQLIESFFNVVLADLRYRTLNEKMAVVYVTLDRLRDRHELGTVSDVALAKAEKDYAELLAQRNEAELAQRQQRLRLAILLGRSDAIIDEVRPPTPGQMKRLLEMSVEDVSELLKKLPHLNPTLVALRQKLGATADRLRWARLQRAPSVRLEAAVGPRYYEKGVNQDSWDMRLRLDWPLLDGGASRQAAAQVSAQRLKLISEYKARLQALQSRVVTLWGRLALWPTRKKWLDAYQDYVDLNMEYRRGLYENEEKTDIGDAMIEQSRLDEATLKTLFAAVLANLELRAILGEEVSCDSGC